MVAEKAVLSIAGLDPSGGAGILADIKTMHQIGVQSFAVCTAVTGQNEESVSWVNWMSWSDIRHQLDPLFELYEIAAVKIGIVQNLQMLANIVRYLRKKRSISWIIWDPVIAASSGTKFLEGMNKKELSNLLFQLDFITPNLQELDQILEVLDLEDVQKLTSMTNVLVKGGHGKGSEAVDRLYSLGSDPYTLSHPRLAKNVKRGTGCSYSSALTAALSKGQPTMEAFSTAKNYVFQLLQTSQTKLGMHHLIKTPS